LRQALEPALFGDGEERAFDFAHNAALVSGELPGEPGLFIGVRGDR